MARVTLKTVADRVGVSRMTVSNAFSKPDQLSAALRVRILEAAAELGYVGPDPAARALARGSVGSVGVLMTDSVSYAFDDEVATAFFSALATGLAPTGLSLSLISSVAAGERVPARDVPMDGAIVYSCQDDSEALGWLRRRGLPLVYVDQPPDPSLSTINVDDRGGARQAAQHIVDLGHRRVGVVPLTLRGVPGASPDRSPHVSSERVKGWADALCGAGINPVVRPASHRDEAAYDVVRDLLDRRDRPTALLCYSDVMAFWAVRAAEDLGLRVPEDLSVVGFDDNPLARRMRPELTTVRQDVRAKGRAAATALTEAIAGAIAGSGGIRALPPRHQTLPTELVVRGTTGPAPDASA
ncbi:LacI family transcriptional regulator [Nocardioides sp. HDW12B]|uniref:LacI family DNA-binding transcriptional regulator n=1 Tax=Nocardioides sp. HDW12B TaxID=2714939 RepID=UPI00140B8198|nr:LacI family DNA-binding transcriptional regulator [Nocardioides sp. HDW12B]QIK68160.1 LacI family transcriptional regulator [Nocardioides sp. HDW12B]